ncbi:MAG: hypothetical protein ACK2TT_06840 [Anaerolineales bacterium]
MADRERKVLLVGSLPYENEEQAMRQALNLVGNDVFSLPDGEIGERSATYPNGNRAAWVQTIIDRCEQDTANWEVVKPAVRGDSGFPTGYDKEPLLKAKHPPSQMHKYLDFRWLEYFQEYYPVFKKLRKEYNLPELKFQVGIPTGLGGTFPAMKPLDSLRYASAFNRRMAYEVNEMQKLADPDDLLLQVEVPAELAFAYQLPDFLVNFSLRTVLDLVKRIEPRSAFGIHLCFGDLNNEALINPPNLERMVLFSNQLVKKWPASHALSYIHYPLAEAADPPPLDVEYYQQLAGIKLPPGVRFIAGFIHEKRSEAEHKHILQAIEGACGTSVDLACSCGLGRRTAAVADQLLELSHQLVRA